MISAHRQVLPFVEPQSQGRRHRPNNAGPDVSRLRRSYQQRFHDVARRPGFVLVERGIDRTKRGFILHLVSDLTNQCFGSVLFYVHPNPASMLAVDAIRFTFTLAECDDDVFPHESATGPGVEQLLDVSFVDLALTLKRVQFQELVCLLFGQVDAPVADDLIVQLVGYSGSRLDRYRWIVLFIFHLSFRP